MALSGNSISKMFKSWPEKQKGSEEKTKLLPPFKILRRIMRRSKQSKSKHDVSRQINAYLAFISQLCFPEEETKRVKLYNSRSKPRACWIYSAKLM